MSDQSLINRYRPTNWDHLIGQEKIVKSVRSILEAKSAHAFIFNGPAGTGKTSIARLIAKAVGCNSRNTTEIDAATNTGVDEMRRVTESMNYSNMFGGSAKVYIVDESHLLSKQAWSSLLKSVEEPPPDVYWIFCTTDAGKIPKAIRTRCAEYTMQPVEIDKLFEFLNTIAGHEGMEISDDIVELIAKKSDGSPRQALSFLSQCANAKDRKEAAALMRSVLDEGEVIDLCRLLAKGADWKSAMVMVKKLESINPESIRINVVMYFVKAILDSKSDEQAGKVCAILSAFKEPYPPGNNMAPLILSLGELLLS